MRYDITWDMALVILACAFFAGVGFRLGWGFPQGASDLLWSFIHGFKRSYNSEDEDK